MSADAGQEKEKLLEVKDLRVWFPIFRGVVQRHMADVKAVDGLSFDVYRGETLGLVGESGCGKSTTGRAILQLHRPTTGQVLLDGQDLTQVKGESLRRMRRQIQMIFQDPYASLNPRMTVGSLISEPLEVHNIGDKSSRRGACTPADVGRGPQPQFHQSLSSRVFRRTAPAYRRSARPSRQSLLRRLRRADFGPGRLHPGTDYQLARGPPGEISPHVSLHRGTIFQWFAISPTGSP